MDHPNAPDQQARLPVLRMSRIFKASPPMLFKAWSSADHVTRWFAPKGCSILEARIAMEPGGAFEFCMAIPDGQKHLVKGRFIEVIRHSRLVIDMNVQDEEGRPLFTALTELDFVLVPGGTRLDLVQSYRNLAPKAENMIAGAETGWTQTLDHLAEEVVRILAEGGGRSAVHGMFSLRRTLKASPDRVWRAFTDPKAKSAWFGGAAGRWELIERQMDVRPGGREKLVGRWEGGVISDFDAHYLDVLPEERLVFSYVMHLNETKISVSLATIEMTAQDGGTLLKITEQGVFLDGYDDAGSREHGTNALMDALCAALEQDAIP